MACFKYNRKSFLFFVIAAIIFTIGFCLSVISIATCSFVTSDGENEGGEFVGFGLFWFEAPTNVFGNQCFFFDWDSPLGNVPYWTGRKINAARICACLASFFAFWLMCVMWMGMCCGCLHGKVMRTLLAISSFFLMALFGGIFAIYGSFSCRGGCSFNKGSWCALFTMICWFISGMILCCTPSSHNDGDDGKASAAASPVAGAAAPAQGEQSVAVETFTNEDGTVVTKTTTTNPDGSKQIEEVTETPLVQAVVDEKV
mmetsp:Transcript_10103/g.28349  ORF Transcript_10103/g.28349 Transcript_10103/m.28349 type:complete len:257 (+) Transcript_10103:108-878(+)